MEEYRKFVKELRKSFYYRTCPNCQEEFRTQYEHKKECCYKRECVECGESFSTSRHNVITCSKACWDVRFRRQKRVSKANFNLRNPGYNTLKSREWLELNRDYYNKKRRKKV